MYVTIPIMQFALLFLSLERLSRHFNLPITCAKIFTKPYLIQVILCAVWIFLIALLITFMFIRRQFNFSFIKDTISNLAPPIIGDVATRFASRRHHCSVDGRLSSVFKTVIIILFIILIIKPIVLSIGFNLLTPFCCRKRRKDVEKQGDRRTTKLVTIILLLNFFFSFPFYFASMFKSVFTRIDATKDTFSIVLKICFILRITNIIFECLAFYIFERNSWNLLRKLFYYGTCKKFEIFNTKSDDDIVYTKNPKVLKTIKKIKQETDDDEEEEDEDDDEEVKIKSKRRSKTEPDEGDDGSFAKKPKKKSSREETETPVASEEDDDDKKPVIKRKRKQSKKKTPSDDEDDDGAFVQKPKKKSTREEEEEEETPVASDENQTPVTKPKRKHSKKKDG